MTKEITGWEKDFYKSIFKYGDFDKTVEFISRQIASAVEAREREIVKEVEKTNARYQSSANDAVNIVLSIINPSKK